MMPEPYIIMPVKDSVERTEQALRAIVASGHTVTIYDDNSTEENAVYLYQLAQQLGCGCIGLKTLTDTHSPNYRTVLIHAQQRAREQNASLLIVESDVVVAPDTIDRLVAAQEEGDGLVAAITVDEAGKVNYPYNEGGKHLSFCCTLLTKDLLERFDFTELDKSKSWFDVTISHLSAGVGLKNRLLQDIQVVHYPHSSRPWKKMKYTNPLRYYWLKWTKGERAYRKIYSLLLVKNEADIIRYSIQNSLRWCDRVIALDNGSTDGTWEILQEMAARDPRIVAEGQYKGPFRIGLRARIWNKYRHELGLGDWWCVRHDADELYTDDVRAILERQKWYITTVSKRSTDYVLSEEDLRKMSGDFGKDRAQYTHTTLYPRRERRFMRAWPWLIWKDTWRYPHPWGIESQERLHVDHYPYRSKEQMELRWETRKEAKEQGCGSFHHEPKDGWRSYLWDGRRLLQNGRNLVWEKDGLVVKEFGVPGLIKRIIYTYLRKSKARRSYEHALLLKGKTPEPIGYTETKRHGLLAESTYTSRLSQCPYTYKDLERADFPHREQHIRAVARFIAELHEQGILHRDLNGGNILLDDNDHIELVDLNRMRFGSKRIDMQKGLRNLKRLKKGDEEMDQILTDEYIHARQ